MRGSWLIRGLVAVAGVVAILATAQDDGFGLDGGVRGEAGDHLGGQGALEELLDVLEQALLVGRPGLRRDARDKRGGQSRRPGSPGENKLPYARLLAAGQSGLFCGV